MSKAAITVEGLGKAYRIGLKDEMPDTLVAAMASWAKVPFRNFQRLSRLNTFGDNGDSEDTVWALRDVNFEVQEGEVVGVIGRNGAGKSTLLKILSRITEPTTGRAVIRGRVSSLLEVGTGFHPELSGRENIYMNGTILGMKKQEIDRKFDEIVEFSGVERFLDTPIKRYSSGMKVRLAFSVAAHLEPEILIVDEVLAVGDAEFQRKCLGKMQDVAGHGRTVLFVSHNMGAVQQLCQHGALLRHGELAEYGPVAAVVQRYLASVSGPGTTPFRRDNPERRGTGGLVLTGGRILDGHAEERSEILGGEALIIECDYENAMGARDAALQLTIYNHLGIAVTNLGSDLTIGEFRELDAAGSFRCLIERSPFPPGQYRIALALHADGQNTDHIPNAIQFAVNNSTFFPMARTPDPRYCTALVDHCWSHEPSSRPRDRLPAELGANERHLRT